MAFERKNNTVYRLICLAVLSILIVPSFPVKPKAGETALKSSLVPVLYKNIIQGYRVEIQWMPIHYLFNSLVGPAIMVLTKEATGVVSTFYYHDFGLPTQKIEMAGFKIKNSSEASGSRPILIPANKPLILTDSSSEFSPPENEWNAGMPFFFFDIDFDSKPEIFLQEAHAGQRWQNAYRVFKWFDVGTECDYCEIEVVPGEMLDSWTEVDTKNKKIEIFGSNGACSNYLKTFKLNTKHEYELKKLMVNENISHNGVCENTTYTVTKTAEQQKPDQKCSIYEPIQTCDYKKFSKDGYEFELIKRE